MAREPGREAGDQRRVGRPGQSLELVGGARARGDDPRHAAVVGSGPGRERLEVRGGQWRRQPEPHARRAGPRQLRRRAVGDQPPAVEHRHVVGQALDVAQLVGREQDRRSGVAEGTDALPRRLLGGRVHAGRRLVQHQQLRPAEQGEREPEALPLATRQPAIAGRGRRAEVDQLEQAVRVLGVLVEPGIQAERLAGRRAGIDAALLEHQPDPGPQPRTVARRVQAEHPDRAGVRAPVALEDLHRRRLAGAVGPQ